MVTLSFLYYLLVAYILLYGRNVTLLYLAKMVFIFYFLTWVLKGKIRGLKQVVALRVRAAVV